jgi:16S rRNA processing protein RimM
MAPVVPPEEGLVLVGVVARTHGLRGQVVVNPETDFASERFATGAAVLAAIDGKLQPLTVSSVRFHQGRPIVGFDGVSSIEAAGRLAGEPLWIREGDRPKLEVGRYYHSELVGCRVETREGVEVGRVARVQSGAGVPLLGVGTGPREVLIPLAESICLEIDAEGKRIVIDPPEGLLELNRPRGSAG